MKKKTNIKECIVGDVLDLSMTDLQDVPVKEIAAFPKITNLDVSTNQIAQLSEYFPLCLTHITKLDLSHNRLTVLPNNFGSLTNLRYLDLSKNKLPTVPLSFGNLKVLNWLDLSENPLVPKISEVVGVCVSPSDCQAAAKKLVAFMAEISKRVTLEKERLKEVKKIEAEQAELEMLKKKEKKEKKKKKKLLKAMENANGKTEINYIDNNEFKQQLNSYSQLPRTKQPNIVWRFFATLIKLIFYAALFSFFAVFVVKLVDEPTYRTMKVRAYKLASEISVHLPKDVVNFFNTSEKTLSHYGALVWRRLADFGQQLIVSGTEWYRWFSTDETVQLYVDSLWNFFHVLYVQLMDVSVSVYTKFSDWIQS